MAQLYLRDIAVNMTEVVTILSNGENSTLLMFLSGGNTLKLIIVLFILKFISNSFSFDFLFDPTKRIYIIAFFVVGVLLSIVLGRVGKLGTPSDNMGEFQPVFWIFALVVLGVLFVPAVLAFFRV